MAADLRIHLWILIIEIQLRLIFQFKSFPLAFLDFGRKNDNFIHLFHFHCLFLSPSLFVVDANCLTHQLFNKLFGALNEWMNESMNQTVYVFLGVDAICSWCVNFSHS